MTPEEEAGVRLVTEAYERWEKMPPHRFLIGRMETFILMNACQAMMTHPQIPEGFKEALEHLGRQFQERVCDTPELYALCEAGWNRNYDVLPPERKQT